MTNDLNDHEQAHTYGVHLHVTYWGTLICHSLKDKGLGYLFH